MPKVYDRSFLLSADLSEPTERLGRRKRAQVKAKSCEVELAAEKQPRTQHAWVESARNSTRLPIAGDLEDGPVGSRPIDRREGGAVGRKKQKRLAVLEANRARKHQKKAAANWKAHQQAAQAVKGKAKGGGVSQGAAALLEGCKGGTADQQRLLAAVAARIASAPEKELGLFDVFLQLYSIGNDSRTRHLSLLSGIAVFCDLVPGYRIREPTELEKATIRSKDVLALERYELELLQVYRKLLPSLEDALKKEPLVFAAALAALLRASSEFNYRQRLISTAVRYASDPSGEVRHIVSASLGDVIAADQRLEVSREVVLAVGRIAQSAAHSASKGGSGSGALQQELVEVLLRLPIGRAEATALQEGAMDVDADEDVRKALVEGSITQGAEKVGKAEAELLTEVFVVYLRILRQRNVHGRGLLVSTLTGLGRWGQQVNIELLLEILLELRGAVKDAVDRGDGLVALHGVNCALVLLSGPSQALTVDVTWLGDAVKAGLMLALPSMYSAHSEGEAWPPPCFVLDGGSDGKNGQKLRVRGMELRQALEAESVPILVLKCIDAALKCPLAYGRASDASLALLIEQLFVLAVDSDPHVGLTMLHEAAQLLRRHQRLHTLLDVEGGLFGLGGITEHALTLVWHLQPLCHSLVAEVVKAGRRLIGAIPRHSRTSLSDVFPCGDRQAWLAAEVPRHLGAGGLGSAALKPPGLDLPSGGRKSERRHGRLRVASFLTEREIAERCGPS